MLSRDWFLELIQTIGIMTNASVLVYVVWRMERAFEHAAAKLGAVIDHQAKIQSGIERIWTKFDDVERGQAALAQRLEAIEKARETALVDH